MVPKRVLVIDTIVLLSAFFGGFDERRLYQFCRAGHVRLTTSAALVAELERALRYPGFAFTDRQVQLVVEDVLSHAFVVEPRERIDYVREDPEDNRVLECAVAGGAHMVASGDPHLLGLAIYCGIPILPAPSALALLCGFD